MTFPKRKRSGEQPEVVHCGQILAVDSLTQGLDLVGMGQQPGETRHLRHKQTRLRDGERTLTLQGR